MDKSSVKNLKKSKNFFFERERSLHERANLTYNIENSEKIRDTCIDPFLLIREVSLLNFEIFVFLGEFLRIFRKIYKKSENFEKFVDNRQ